MEQKLKRSAMLLVLVALVIGFASLGLASKQGGLTAFIALVSAVCYFVILIQGILHKKSTGE